MTDTRDASAVIQDAKTIVFADWPSKDVRGDAGSRGLLGGRKGGPEPDSCTAYEAEAGDILRRARPPADLVGRAGPG